MKDRIAIVTGGGTGIGRAVSVLLAARGAKVAVVYSRSAAEAQAVVAEIAALGGQVIALQASIADEGAVNAMISQTVKAFGGLDYLVNNAAITHQLKFDDLEAVTGPIWDDLLNVNVKGTFNCCKAAAPYLKARAGSAIVNVGSIAGETGFGSSLPYAVSKAAVHGMTRSLARALAPHVRVNCIAPGAVKTRWWDGNEDKMHMLSGKLPLQRISTPEDIAELVVAVLQACSMTGQVIKAENGQTL